MAKLLLGISGRVEAGEVLTAVVYNTGTGSTSLSGFTLQWQVFNGTSWSNVGAANSLTLTVPNNSTAIGLSYRLMATPSGAGDEATNSASTAAATLDKSNAKAPTLDGVATNLTLAENAPATLLDSSVTFGDQDNGNYGGGSLSILNSNSLSAGGDGLDLLSVRNQGTGSGQFSYDAATRNVYYASTAGSPVLIGQVDAGFNGNGADLKIAFNTNATKAIVDKLIEDIQIANNDDSPTLARLITIKVVDPTGGSVQRVMQVGVTPSPDAPVFTGAASFTVDENQVSAGSVGAVDPDREASAPQGITFSLVSGTGATDNALFTIDGSTGALSFATAPDYEGAHGASYSVRVRASDSNGGISEQVVTIQLRNVNEAPQASNVSATAHEDGGAVTIAPAYSDPDAGDTHTIGIDATGAVGTVTVVNGQFEYDVGSAFQQLAAGQSAVDTFTYTVTDAGGLSSTQTVSVTVLGANDAPTSAGGIATGSTFEDATSQVQGQLPSADIDSGDTRAWTGTASGTYGNFAIDSSTGQWTYTLDNARAATQSLTQGQSVTDTFTATVTDAFGASAQRQVVISITGQEDAPVISASSQRSGSTDEDSTTVVAGTLVASDADAGDTLTWAGTRNGSYGQLTVNADGTWTYNLDNARAWTQGLREGQSAIDSFSVWVTDSSYGTASTTISISIRGHNDIAAIAGPASVTVTEDDAVQGSLVGSATLSISDADFNEDQFVYTQDALGSAGYGRFSIDVAGHWSYRVDNAQSFVQSLGAGQSLSETYTVRSADGTATQVLTGVIAGVNDAPVSTGGTATGAVTEDGVSLAQGALTASDADAGDTSMWSGNASGTYGNFAIDAASGQWTYSLDNARSATQALNKGETVVEHFAATVSDGHGGATLRDVAITVTGANDFPGISDASDFTGFVKEDSDTAGTASGKLYAAGIDPDQGDQLQFFAGDGNGIYGQFLLTAQGDWTYTLDNSRPVTQALGDGETATDTFYVMLEDQHGGYVQQQVTITVSGTAEPVPVISGTTAGVVGEPGGGAGWTTLDVVSGPQEASHLLQQADGKLVVCAEGYNASTTTIARYTADGSLDKTFGADGFVTVDGYQADMAFDPQGRIVLATEQYEGVAITRLTADGQLDAGFGASGRLQTAIQGLMDTDLVIDAQGRMLVMGETATDSQDLTIQRYLADGSIDGTFGSGGFVTVQGTAPTWNMHTEIDSAGRIVIASTYLVNSAYTTEFTRLLANGQLDTTFGAGGHLTFAAPTYNAGEADFVLAADDKIMVAFADTSQHVAVARLSIDGTLDTSFANGGTAQLEWLWATQWDRVLLETDSSGHWIVGGAAGSTSGPWTVERLNADGTPDTAYNSFANPFPLNAYAGRADNELVTVADGSVLMKATVLDSQGEAQTGVARLTSTGSFDHGFGIGASETAAGQLTADRTIANWSGSTQGAWGTFSIDAATGQWTYVVDPSTDSLQQQDVVHDNFTVTATDTTGASSQVTVAIDVHGQDDAPQIVGGPVLDVTVPEDMPGTSGTFQVIDPDANDTHWWEQGTVDTGHSFFTVYDGSWSYGADPAWTQQLGAGQTVIETFTARVHDSMGESDSVDIRITITGENDAPTLAWNPQTDPPPGGTVVEPGASTAGVLTATGAIAASDPDAGDTLTWSVDFAPSTGTLSVDPSTGTWTYTLDAQAADSMAAGEVTYVWGGLRVTDGSGASAVAPVQIRIEGSNDAPIVWQPGSTDTGFVPAPGITGAVTVDLHGDGMADFGMVSARDANGTVFVLDHTSSGAMVTRLTAAGQIDTTFGNNGSVAVGVSGSYDNIAIAPDGKILVSGSDTGPGGNSDFSVVRLNADGSPDWNFGPFGRALVDFAGGNDYAANMLFDGAGGVIVVGHADVPAGTSLAMARLDAGGQLDPMLDGDGKWTFDAASSANYQLTAASDSSDLVWGYSDGQAHVYRIWTDGTRDMSFGNGGELTFAATSYPHLVVASGGDFVLAWPDGSSMQVARFTGNGQLDYNFGNFGVANVAVAAGGWISALTFDAQGHLLLAGTTGGSAPDALVMRLDASGALDATFGNGGVATQDIDHGSTDEVRDVYVDAQGHVLVAGDADHGGGMKEFALWSVLADGTNDPQFGTPPPNATVSGTLQAYDVDNGDYASLVWSGSANGTYGTLTMQSSVGWTYEVDNARTATQDLGYNEVAQDTFTVMVTDAAGAATTHDIVVTVVGV